MLAFLIGSPIESATIKFEFSLLFNLITYFYFLDFINTPGGHHQEGLIKRYREIHFDCSTDFRNTSVRFTVLSWNDTLQNNFYHKKFLVILKIDVFFMMFVDIFKKNDYDDHDIFINIEREVYSESKEGEHGAIWNVEDFTRRWQRFLGCKDFKREKYNTS